MSNEQNKIHMSVGGLIGSQEEVEEVKYITKLFLLGIRIRDLVLEGKEKYGQLYKKVDK